MMLRLIPDKVPDNVKRHITKFIYKRINVGRWLPPLKIMETEEVEKVKPLLDFIFGTKSFGMEDDDLPLVDLPILESLVQDKEYQILYFRENMYEGEYVGDFDQLYVDLDRYGSLWIPQPNVEKDLSRSTYIRYSTQEEKGHWQIQYAYPTHKRIVSNPDIPEDFVPFMLDENGDEMGYVYSRSRPKIPFKK